MKSAVKLLNALILAGVLSSCAKSGTNDGAGAGAPPPPPPPPVQSCPPNDPNCVQGVSGRVRGEMFALSAQSIRDLMSERGGVLENYINNTFQPEGMGRQCRSSRQCEDECNNYVHPNGITGLVQIDFNGSNNAQLNLKIGPYVQPGGWGKLGCQRRPFATFYTMQIPMTVHSRSSGRGFELRSSGQTQIPNFQQFPGQHPGQFVGVGDLRIVAEGQTINDPEFEVVIRHRGRTLGDSILTRY